MWFNLFTQWLHHMTLLNHKYKLFIFKNGIKRLCFLKYKYNMNPKTTLLRHQFWATIFKRLVFSLLWTQPSSQGADRTQQKGTKDRQQKERKARAAKASGKPISRVSQELMEIMRSKQMPSIKRSGQWEHRPALIKTSQCWERRRAQEDRGHRPSTTTVSFNWTS